MQGFAPANDKREWLSKENRIWAIFYNKYRIIGYVDSKYPDTIEPFNYKNDSEMNLHILYHYKKTYQKFLHYHDSDIILPRFF